MRHSWTHAPNTGSLEKIFTENLGLLVNKSRLKNVILEYDSNFKSCF